MLAGTIQTWIKRRIAVRQRLARICTSYLLFLMVVTTKHSLEEAARFSGLHKSLFSKLLKSHSKVATTTLERLSKTQARQFAKALARRNGLPWKSLIIIDSTLQHRASLHPENAQTFNHGKGYVIGHQWTNIVLLLGDILIPLKPIPFYSKRYCQTHGLAYHSEHERVVAYLRTLDLEDYIGAYDQREVLVLADSGYDNKKIEKAIADKGWHFIIALGKTRSVKSAALSLTDPSFSAVVSHRHVFPPSSQAQVDHHSSGDEWEQTQANGRSRSTHLGLFALRGQGRVSVFRTTQPTGWSPQVSCLQ
jgi:DDE family transposase